MGALLKFIIIFVVIAAIVAVIIILDTFKEQKVNDTNHNHAKLWFQV